MSRWIEFFEDAETGKLLIANALAAFTLAAIFALTLLDSLPGVEISDTLTSMMLSGFVPLIGKIGKKVAPFVAGGVRRGKMAMGGGKS